jgi:protein-L-isoaspartate O-methyltransferase
MLRVCGRVCKNVHRSVLDVIPAGPAHVLDVGAGSGRDAAALARRGHHVTAVEPSAGFRAEAALRHAGLSIEWIDDGLPGLASLGSRSYDLVLLSAVWMHVPANRILQERIHLLTCPIGRPPNEVRRSYANFIYQAGSWTKSRREWHPGELYPRVGFIVTNMSRPAENVVAFYNKRGTCEQ